MPGLGSLLAPAPAPVNWQAAVFAAAGFVGYGQFRRSQAAGFVAAGFVGYGQFLRSQAASFVRWFCRSKRLHFRLWLQFRRSQMMLNHYFVPKMPQSSICLPRWHDTTTRKNNRTQGVRLYLYYLLHNFHVKQELGWSPLGSLACDWSVWEFKLALFGGGGEVEFWEWTISEKKSKKIKTKIRKN